jgi:hypothetical protein
MNNEFPKSLYRGGEWDGVSEPDCVVVANADEQTAQAANGYLPFGTAPDGEPAKRKPGRPRKEAA